MRDRAPLELFRAWDVSIDGQREHPRRRPVRGCAQLKPPFAGDDPSRRRLFDLKYDGPLATVRHLTAHGVRQGEAWRRTCGHRRMIALDRFPPGLPFVDIR